MSKVLTRLMLTLTLCTASAAQAITIDGNLADWGLARTGKATDWTPDSNLVPEVAYVVEDQTGGSGSRVYPGWGGQAYDVEAMYAYLADDSLYLAIATGVSPTTPNTSTSYGAGDIAIDFGRDGSFEFGIETTGADAGKVYAVSAWKPGLWDVNGNYSVTNPDPAHPTSMQTAVEVGTGTLVYTSVAATNMGAYKTDKHYFIEAAIPLVTFDGYTGDFDVHWTMNCANDALSVNSTVTGAVPEPGTLALLPLGMLGLAGLRRRKSAQ